MKRLTFPLPYNHTGVAEIYKDEVILYIEKPGTILWGLVDWPERCTGFTLYHLSNNEDYCGVVQQRVIHGRLGHYQIIYKNIDTFDPRAELERMFETYQAEQQRADAWEKRVEAFTKNI